MIRLKNVSKSFDHGKTAIVKDVSFTLEKGEILVILGSSGAGKSTIIKMINRLVTMTSGDIEVNGRSVMDYDIVSLRRSMGYVIQGIGLFPHLTVRENITVLLNLIKTSKINPIKKADELLDLVGLDPAKFAKRFPVQLSGGQQQRVGVARALATDPEYLLMDEPFGALDAIVRDDLQCEILRLKKELNKTILFVTHDIFEAVRLANRIAIMHNGSLLQIGEPKEVIQAPQKGFVEELLNKTITRVHDMANLFDKQTMLQDQDGHH